MPLYYIQLHKIHINEKVIRDALLLGVVYGCVGDWKLTTVLVGVCPPLDTVTTVLLVSMACLSSSMPLSSRWITLPQLVCRKECKLDSSSGMAWCLRFIVHLPQQWFGQFKQNSYYSQEWYIPIAASF